MVQQQHSSAVRVLAIALGLLVGGAVADLNQMASQHNGALTPQDPSARSITSRWQKKAGNSPSGVVQLLSSQSGQQLGSEGQHQKKDKALISEVQLKMEGSIGDRHKEEEKSDATNSTGGLQQLSSESGQQLGSEGQNQKKDKALISEVQLKMEGSSGDQHKDEEKSDATNRESQLGSGSSQHKKEESLADRQVSFEVRFSVTQEGLNAAGITSAQIDTILLSLEKACEKIAGDDKGKLEGAAYILTFSDHDSGNRAIIGLLKIDFKGDQPVDFKTFPGADITDAVHTALPEAIVGPVETQGSGAALRHGVAARGLLAIVGLLVSAALMGTP